MKLKCRINGKDYDIVQGCSFIDNFNETLDSGTICLDQVYQIKNLQPYDDVFIWNADEEFIGYRNVGDIINLRYDIQKTESGGDVSNSSSPGSSGINITEKNDFYELSGMICDIWSYYFYDFTSENESNCRFGTPQMSLRLHVFVESPNGRTSAYLDDCMIKSSSSHGKNSDEIFFGNNNVTFNCQYFENSRTFSINKNNKIGENNYIIKEITVVSSSYTAKNINKVFETTIYKEDFSSSSILDFGIRFSYIGSKREYYLKNIIDNIEGDFSRKRVRLDGVDGGELDFAIYKNDDKWQFTFQNNAPTGGIIDSLGFYPYYMLPFIDDMSIIILTSENKEESVKPTFYKHMLVDNFSEEMVGLETGLYKYTIDLFSETKKLEKIILPNISITQSLLESEKRTCWFYLEKYVDTFSPKYKKVFNAINNEWQYVNKYAVSETGTDSNGIIANLKPLFDKTICPEMTLTNPSLRDVLSRIMIVKDIIPIVKDDVIYGLDISNTTGTFNRDGVNFTVSSMSSGNFATDARREYSGALSQENSAHLVEYLGFRSPNSPFLTLDDMVLETRFPIYKINNIKMCYYKKVELVAGSGSGLSNKDKIIFVKQDITPLVLQNVVRNSLSSNWSYFNNGQTVNNVHDFSNIDYSDTAFDGATDPSGKMQYASQFKLCTVGYDIGSNKITGWGTKYEYLDFLWFKNSCTYIENMVNLVDNINPFGDLTRYEIKEGNSGYSDIRATNGINSIVDFNGNTGSWSNIATKIKSIVFEIDYIAMYDGSIIHGKENIDKDDIITPDNCSSSLTVLESDGLFEREKMNRLGNKTIKFTARYDDDNDGSNLNRVQNVGTYDPETDSIIYIREYSIFDKMILANYEATHEYILKNYFTSVWAKYRTYSLMSYGESVKRAENVKKTLVLSKNSAFYENRYNDDELLFDNLETTELFLSFLTPTQIENNEIKHKNKLNCGYFLFYHQNGSAEQTRYFLSDINSFASGTSICFNIKTYDNVSAGSYIDSMQESLTIKDISDIESQLDYKTTQKWWSMVNSDSDAFEEKIGFYVCNLDQHNFFKDGVYDDSTEIVTNIMNNADRYMKLPGIVDGDVQSFNDNIKNKIGVKKKIICKDNKESLDITMQFSYFTSEKNDIFFSPWVCKLNDLIGYYDKFETTIKRITDADPSCPMTIYGYDGEFASTTYVDKSFKTLVLKIDKDKFNMLSNGTTYDVSNIICNLILNGIDYHISQGVPLSGVTANGTATLEIKTITKISNINEYTHSGSCDLECSLKGNYSGETFDYISILGIPIKTNKRSFSGQDSKNSTITLTFDSVVDNYAYLQNDFESNFLRSNDILYYNKPFYWFSGKYGTDNIADLDEYNSLVSEGQADVSSLPTEVLRKNMFIVVSREKIKNNLEFNYYRYDDNNSNFGSNMMIDNHNVGQIFSIFKSDGSFIGITVHAEEYSNYSQQHNFDIKSIQYYYRDNNTNIMYFVFGVNLLDDLDGNTSFEPFNIYLSAMSKRSMNVYDEDHNIIGKVANAIDINNFEEQKYELNQNIPSEYQEVDYLESDGRQYIRVLNELSDIPGANFEIDFMVFDNKDTTEHYILGVENELGPDKSGMSMKVGFNETQNKAIATILFTDNAVIEIESNDVVLLPNQKYNAKFYSNALYVNGILKAEINYYETTYYSPQGIGLFACVNTTSDDNYNILAKKFNGRIYNFKIYSISSLVANLVPCIRLIDNKPGMFDKISKRFYTNEGLGEFKFKI